MRKRGSGQRSTPRHRRHAVCIAALCPSIDAISQINYNNSEVDSLLTPLLT